jgi:threonine dehydratase
MPPALKPATLEELRAAAERIQGLAIRTPLVRLNVDDGPAEIWLKLENLQPIGSFKIRGAGNKLRSVPAEDLAQGVYTASSGNMAQGVSWTARQLGVAATVIVPESADKTKLAAVERFGGTIKLVPFERWWQTLVEHGYPDQPGLFVHPVADPAVVAGNGTAGLEIFEDLPDVDTVVVPYGGGGLISGVASALKALKPDVRVLAAESEAAEPVAAALAAGHPVEVPYGPNFITGMGGRSVLPEMWPMVRGLIDGAVTSSLGEVAAAIRLIFERNRVVAEGAGAAPVAAALAGRAGGGKIVCVVSGGNLDADNMITILGGGVP